jgi:hypothetical protein
MLDDVIDCAENPARTSHLQISDSTKPIQRLGVKIQHLFTLILRNTVQGTLNKLPRVRIS